MALKFRRGTTAQKSGSLAFGEPYVNTTLGTLQIGLDTGDITLSAIGTGSNLVVNDITASNLHLTGNAIIDGNVNIGGAITIGDQSTDTINVVAAISSSLIPSGNDSFDLGSKTKRYATSYTNHVSASTIEVWSGSNAQIQINNGQTGIGYHLQNTDGGNFNIHNSVTGQSIFRIDSGSIENQHGHFFGGLYVSGVIDSLRSVSAPQMIAGGFTGSFTGSVAGIGNVTEYSASVDSKISASNAQITANSQSVYDTLNWPTTGLIASISSSINSATASLSASIYDSIFGLSSNALSYSIHRDLYGDGFMTTGSFGELSGSIHRDIYGDGMFTTGLSGSIASTQNMFSMSVATEIGSLNTSASALIISASSAKMTNDLQDTSISNLNSYTSSLQAGIEMTGSTVSFLGNIVVYGTQSIINSTNVEISDNILYLAPTASIDNDLGVVGHYNDGTYRHAGIFMDASDGHSWKVFNGLTTETSAQIDTAGNGFTLADFKAGTITGTSFTATSSTASFAVPAGGKFASSLDASNHYVPHDGFGSQIFRSNGVEKIIIGYGSAGAINLSGSVTAPQGITAELTGNASTATALKTSRTINGTIFDGTQNITILDLVSGSSQITLSSVTGYSTLATTYEPIASLIHPLVSGSAQVKSLLPAGTVSGSVQVLGGTGIVSGSGQITYASISSIPSGIVSGSTQVTPLLPTGTISGSTQVTGLTNAQLNNSTISGKALGTNLDALTISTGLSGTSYNGSSAVTIANTGVLSITSNTGLSGNVNATGNVTITNTGVTSAVAGTGVSVSGATGAVTFSIGQAVATTSAVTFASVAATGDIVAYSTSDRRHKNNIQTIPNALEKVSKLNGVTWEWNDDVEEVTKLSPKTGLIAQEVQQVLPEVVTERENGFLGLDYSKMVGLLVEAIKEQQIKIDNLTVQVEELKKHKGL